MKNKTLAAHLLALFTVTVWGTTFVSTSILLKKGLSPHGIMLVRFVIGYISLCVLSRKRLKTSSVKEELLFVAAGLCGMTVYQLCENLALTLTQASNVSVLVSVAPLFTGLLASRFSSEKLTGAFIIGFIISISGIFVISINDSFVLKLSPHGDILAVISAVVWAIYTVITKKLGSLGYDTISVTRRIFFYGMLSTAAIMPIFGFDISKSYIAGSSVILNLLYLGVIASAMCFVIWNFAVKTLGASKSSVYIYLIPLVTIIFSVIFLKERITLYMIAGTVLIISGLIISTLNNSAD